jgi:hypothetical protein
MNVNPSSVVPLQLSSIPLQLSVAAGLIAMFPSLQSELFIEKPNPGLLQSEVPASVRSPKLSLSRSV